MKDRIAARLYRLEPRMLLLVMGATILFIGLESWMLVLRQPLADWTRLKSERAGLERPATAADRVPAEIVRLEQDITALTRKLQGNGPQLAEDQMVVYVIDRLDHIAARHGARLGSVRPAATKRILMFDEVSFDIKVSGKYQSLYQWMRDTEEELGPLVVTKFSMQTDTASVLTMDLKLAAYRLAPEGSAAK